MPTAVQKVQVTGIYFSHRYNREGEELEEVPILQVSLDPENENYDETTMHITRPRDEVGAWLPGSEYTVIVTDSRYLIDLAEEHASYPIPRGTKIPK